MKRYELSFLDELCGREVWIDWKSYSSEAGAEAAAKSLLQGLWKSARLAKVRDRLSGTTSLYGR